MPAMLGRVAAHGSKENTEPVAPSSTTPTSFPPGLAASAYDPQERLQPRSAPCSVHCQPKSRDAPTQVPLAEEPRKEREGWNAYKNQRAVEAGQRTIKDPEDPPRRQTVRVATARAR